MMVTCICTCPPCTKTTITIATSSKTTTDNRIQYYRREGREGGRGEGRGGGAGESEGGREGRGEGRVR